MSAADTVRATIDAFNRGGIEAAAEFFHPEIEWETTGMFVEADTYRGHDGIRRYMGAFEEEFTDLRFTVPDIAHEENPVVYLARLDVVGRHSGAPVTIDLWVVAEVRDGKIARQRNFRSREEALAAAGVSAA